MSKEKKKDLRNLSGLKKLLQDNNSLGVAPIDITDGDNTIKKYYDVKNYALNYMLSKKASGGYPHGRIIAIVGNSHSGKTALALQIAKGFDVVVYFITEVGAFEKEFAEIFAERGKEQTIIQQGIITTEDLEKEMVAILNWKKQQEEDFSIFMVIDSIANLTTEAEKDGQQGYGGGRPLHMRRMLRQYQQELSNNNINIAMLTHYTTSMEPAVNKFSKPEPVISGGTIIEFAASLLLETSKNNKANLTYAGTILGAQQVGIQVKAKKSRMGTYLMKIPFIIDNKQGIKPLDGLFLLCKDMEILRRKTKSGSHYYLPGLYTKTGEIGKYDGVIDEERDKAFFEKEFGEILEKDEKLLKKVIELVDNFSFEDFLKQKENEKGFDIDRAFKKDLVPYIMGLPNNKLSAKKLQYMKTDELKKLCKKLLEEVKDLKEQQNEEDSVLLEDNDEEGVEEKGEKEEKEK